MAHGPNAVSRPKERQEMSAHHVTVTVNGEQRTAEVEARKLLVHLLREDFSVTSAHVGCDTTQCGACTVRLDGHAVKSCTVLAVQADGAAIDTIESLSGSGDAEHPLLSAFRGHHALQCGFCTPGMVMSSLELLQRERNPSEERVRGCRNHTAERDARETPTAKDAPHRLTCSGSLSCRSPRRPPGRPGPCTTSRRGHPGAPCTRRTGWCRIRRAHW